MEVVRHVLPQFSRGIVPRLRNLASCRSMKADVYHIAGDVHYLTLATVPERTVLTILDCGPLERLKGIRHAIVRLLWFTIPSRRCASITVISDETKKSLIQHLPFVNHEKIFVVPVSVSNRFQFFNKEFDDQKPRVLHVGTKENKNLNRTMKHWLAFVVDL